MKIYYIYMVMCTDGTFYVGVTNNLERRIGEHNFGLDPHCYTFSRRPVVLVYSEDFHDIVEAIAVEKKLKKWSHVKKSALARGDWATISRLAKTRDYWRPSNRSLNAPVAPRHGSG